MHARRRTLFGATCAALITSTTLATSSPPPPEQGAPTDAPATTGDAVANGALTLPPLLTPAPGATPMIETAVTEPAPAAPPAAVDPGPPPAPSPNESKPLGHPNRALSARPATGDAASGPLAAIDPRRNEMVRVGGALAIVLGLLLLTRAALRRAPGMLGGAGRPAGVVEVLARYPIARGQSLIVLRMARRILLLHHTGSTMVTLSEAADPEEVASILARLEAGSRAPGASRFRAKLRDFDAEHDRVLAQEGLKPRNGPGDALDRGEIVDLTRGSGRRLTLPGKRRLSA